MVLHWPSYAIIFYGLSVQQYDVCDLLLKSTQGSRAFKQNNTIHLIKNADGKTEIDIFQGNEVFFNCFCQGQGQKAQ